MGKDDLYRVNKIVDKRIMNNVEEYLIRWEGYTNEDDTWQKEQDCVNCYNLILKFETTQFESQIKKEIPKIIELKKDCRNRIKLLVEWDVTKTRQFFYSAVILCHDPHMLINFYENNVHIANQDDDELLHFHNSISKSEKILANAKPHKIFAAVNCNGEKLYLLSFRNEEEASIVDDTFVKMKCPSLLVKFYEKHLQT